MPKFIFQAITRHVATEFINKCNELGFPTKGTITSYPDNPFKYADAEIISEASHTQLLVVLETMKNVMEITQSLRYHPDDAKKKVAWPFPVTERK